LSFLLVLMGCAPAWKPFVPASDVDTLPRRQVVQIVTRGDVAPDSTWVHYWSAVILTHDSVTGISFHGGASPGAKLTNADTTRQRLPRAVLDELLVPHSRPEPYVLPLLALLTPLVVYTILNKCHDPFYEPGKSCG
jgi:hypothetical protein